MTGILANRTVLVVEDEYVIAAELRRALLAENAYVVGPFGDLATALRHADDEPIDLAIIDINLRGTLSYPLADRLAASQVPFLFLTGYDDWVMPEDYAACPRMAKPFSMSRLVEAVSDLLNSAMD